MSIHSYITRNLTSTSIGLAVLLGGVVEVQAQFHFGEPENLGPVVNSEYADGNCDLSSDGLSLLFQSDRPGGEGGWDLWMTRRDSASDPWQSPINLGSVVNSPYNEYRPSISADGLELYFNSGNRPGGVGGDDLWVTVRNSASDPWETPRNLGPPVNTSYPEGTPDLSADGLKLYFSSLRPGGQGSRDLWMTARNDTEDPWQTPVNLGPIVNSDDDDRVPSISTSGITLFFGSRRPGGQGGLDIWMTTRESVGDPWDSPVVLPPPINTEFGDAPNISPDGRTLYFRSARPGGYGEVDLWQVAVYPCHGDLNRDGEVGLADLAQLLGNYGATSGMTYGDGDLDEDGDVDLGDLAILLSLYGTPCP